jgi:hypothetical protein
VTAATSSVALNGVTLHLLGKFTGVS